SYEVRLASLAAQPTDGVALNTITQALATGWTDVSYNNNGSINTGLNVTNPVITLGAVTASKPNVNFGIDALPAAVTVSATSAVNPGGANNAVVPATSFSGTDAVDLAGGSISYVRLTAFPANATSITVTGALTAGGAVTTTTYTAGTFPAAGLYIATGANGNLSNANAVQVDPVNGAASVALSYKVVDAAGIESASTGTASVSFTDLVVSGSVYNDVNGGTINGPLISSAGGALYVNLVNAATNTVVASKAVSGGAYSFNTADGLQNNITTYALVLTNAATATGSTLPSTAWTYTAEGVSGTTGDGAPNGTYAFGASITASTVIDFGVDALPATTALTTAATQQNPGGTNTVTVPATAFSGTDADAANGGVISYVHITDFPANATTITLIGSTTIGGPVTTTIYTSATFPAGGVYIATAANGNLSNAAAVKVDPVNGAVNVDIPYRAVDNAGKESLASGAARQPLSDVSISGSVYDDPDAGIINGTLRSNAGGQLYVNLVSGTTLVASKAVSAAGTYSFSTADGLQNNVGDYTLVLTNTALATTSTLPSAAFTYTAEGTTGTTGDGLANGTFTFGANVTANTVIDFGIDALPTVTALTTATSQVNPGGTATITVPASTFSGADAGDLSGGLVSYILLTAFPANATSITVTGATTIGGAVTTTTYTSGTFPGGGLYIATNGAGNPSTTITVDPANGALNVDFSYRSIDNAGKASTATGTARQPLSDLVISGTVYDDADGNSNALIDGTPISNANGQLFVNLVNTAGNTVVASRSLSNGTFSFGTADGLRNDISTYALVLTDAAGNTVAALSSNWVNTGEGLSGTSGDANANGRFLFGANVTTNKVIDFGIDALPAPAALTTATAQVNPGGTATVTIPATTFSGTDASDLSGGRINYIHILSFPANATTVTFAAAATTPGGATANATYTTANFPVGGVYIATNAAGNPSSAIVVDPANGAVNVDFTYKVVDNANRESAASGIARQPLTDLTIAGTVYDDVTAGTIDGTPISNAGGQLYVNLVNTATNTVVASQALTDGTFSFGTADGLRNDIGTYRLVLTSSASATASTLPSTAWVYMAEGSSGTSGDALANGTFDFGGNVGTSRTIDFAIEALPVPAALTIATPQVNPGGTNTVTIPAATFVASDATDLGGGAVSYIRITALPANATSVTLSGSTTPGGPVSTVTYGTGFTAFPAGGVYLATNASGNPTQAITVDPVNGAVNVDFTFTAIDNSGKESLTSGIARQPLTDIAISGTIYDDVNGTKDGIINGTPVGSLSSTQLYVSLVSGGNVVATQAVAGNGTYSFSSANGVQTGTTYTVVLSTTAGTIGQPAPAAALPSGWVNTAEGTTAAGDGDHNGQASTGALAGNSTVNFGVNALPVATSSTSTALANPSGNTLVTIPSASFPGTDPEVNNTGEISFVHLTSFPSNVTSVYAYSSTSVNGPFAFATYTSFPAGGIYLPTSLPGYLLPVDALQIDPVDNALNAQFN
ncbi:beta strand repeat-containing protein, partial [Flaviaesturariibacter aridisoli]|uniref:beta strand repeat-containing protein n=1 Tax=Flaviaesturariibacter aridisoli TaxID=2545761 RepID=UPI001404935E